MGFKFTPVVAQTAVCACLREAADRLGLTYVTPEERVPAPVMVWKKGERIVLIAIVWYDNIFINAVSHKCREAFVSQVRSSFNRTRIVVKGDMVLSEGEVEYLGVIYQVHLTEARTVIWRHAPSNMKRWKILASTEAISGRDWLERLGVINWHIRLKGTNWRDIRPLFREVFNAIGTKFSELESTVRLPNKTVAGIDSWLKEAISGETFMRTSKPLPQTTCFLATDASNWGMGGLLLETGGATVLTQRPWNETEQMWHINRKETRAAIETIRELKRTAADPLRIVLALDNVAAKAWMQGNAFPESEIEGEVFELQQDFPDDTFEFIWVKSADNPADHPSRNEKVCETLVDSCLAVMQSQTFPQWM